MENVYVFARFFSTKKRVKNNSTWELKRICKITTCFRIFFFFDECVTRYRQRATQRERFKERRCFVTKVTH